MSRLILDAGAFLSFERGENVVRFQLKAARELELEVITISPVVAQIWRDGRRQAQIARLLAGVRVTAPDEHAARRAGELLVRTKTRDVVDALLVELASEGDTIVTSDEKDIRRLVDAARVYADVISV